MTCRVHVFPPSKVTALNRPRKWPERVEIVTMFWGLVGFIAIASSAWLPGSTLVLMFESVRPAVAGTVIAATTARASAADDEKNIVRSLRSRITLALPGRFFVLDCM